MADNWHKLILGWQLCQMQQMFIIPIGTATELRESHNRYSITAVEQWSNWVLSLGSSSTDRLTNSVSLWDQHNISFASATERMSEIFLYESLHNFSAVVPILKCRSETTQQQPGGTEWVWSGFSEIFKTFQHPITIPGSMSYEWQ